MSKKLWFMSLLALFALALSACAAQAATAVEADAETAAVESSEAAPAEEGEAQTEDEHEGEAGPGEGQQGGQPGPNGPQGGQPGPGPQGGQPGPARGNPGGPNAWQVPHIMGEILSIDGEQFTMEGRGDDELTVLLSDETSFIGSAESLADLAVGDEVAIAGHRGDEEGTLEARVIMLAADLPLGTPMGGEVSAVGSDSITLETRGGQSFTFTVNGDTDYLSRENAVQALADIEVGQHVVVVFSQAADGSLSANLIVAGGQPDEAPPADSDTAG